MIKNKLTKELQGFKDNLSKGKKYLWGEFLNNLDIGKGIFNRGYSQITMITQLFILYKLETTTSEVFYLIILAFLSIVLLQFAGIIYKRLGLQGAEYVARTKVNPYAMENLENNRAIRKWVDEQKKKEDNKLVHVRN